MKSIDVMEAINELDKILSQKKKSYTLYTCGGAALVFLGYDDRRTTDIDIIVAKMDKHLVEAAKEVADKLNINQDWLNNKVAQSKIAFLKGGKSFVKRFSQVRQ